MYCISDKCLHHVKEEVMSHVVTALFRIVVHPAAIVHGDAHFSRIAIVEIWFGTIMLLRPEVLRVIDVRIMEESIVVLRRRMRGVLSTETLLLSLNGLTIPQRNSRS